jgi:hypothetical protein
MASPHEPSEIGNGAVDDRARIRQLELNARLGTATQSTVTWNRWACDALSSG